MHCLRKGQIERAPTGSTGARPRWGSGVCPHTIVTHQGVVVLLQSFSQGVEHSSGRSRGEARPSAVARVGRVPIPPVRVVVQDRSHRPWEVRVAGAGSVAGRRGGVGLGVVGRLHEERRAWVRCRYCYEPCGAVWMRQAAERPCRCPCRCGQSSGASHFEHPTE